MSLTHAPHPLYKKSLFIHCSSPDPNVVVQKKMRGLPVEAIVRGYLWGSMANAYENGERTFCGLNLPNGLLRYQKLDQPIFTPTTKAENGAHDENMTFAEVEQCLGANLAAQVRDISYKLFERGQRLFREKGLLLLDTKYEFGVDPASGKLFVIDEVNTPDSSRMVSVEEYESKWTKIANAAPAYSSVSELIKAQPALKMKEQSKQFVRDTLLEMGFKPEGVTGPPELSTAQVLECSYRYISIYEQLVGQAFPFARFADSIGNVGKRVIGNLVASGQLRAPGLVVACGSASATADVKSACKKQGLVVVQEERDEATVVAYYAESDQPIVVVSAKGATGALAKGVHPVLSSSTLSAEEVASAAAQILLGAERSAAPGIDKEAALLAQADAAAGKANLKKNSTGGVAGVLMGA